MNHEDLNKMTGELLFKKREIEVQIKVNEDRIRACMKYANESTTEEKRSIWEDEIKGYKERNRFLGYELVNTQKEISDLLDKEENKNDH